MIVVLQIPPVCPPPVTMTTITLFAITRVSYSVITLFIIKLCSTPTCWEYSDSYKHVSGGFPTIERQNAITAAPGTMLPYFTCPHLYTNETVDIRNCKTSPSRCPFFFPAQLTMFSCPALCSCDVDLLRCSILSLFAPQSRSPQYIRICI